VPEAAMHEDDRPTRCEYEIGLAGQVCLVKSVTEPHFMHESPDS
jgi:hypothetical protein